MTTPPKQLFSAACNGVTVTADAYAALNANNHRENILYFISLIGPQAATKAVAASILKEKPETITLEQLETEDETTEGLASPKQALRAVREHGSSWRRVHRQLPLVKAWHVMLWDRRAEPDYNGEGFILLGTEDQQHNANLHLRFLRSHTGTPLHPSWAGWTWARAIMTEEAVPMKGQGVNAYSCTPNETALRQDITKAIRSGTLTADF